MRITVRGTLLLSACLAPYHALAQQSDVVATPPSEPAALSNGAERGFGDIVVTAQKRAERLQDVPVAVTALTAVQIQDQKIQNVIDLGSRVPSLIVRKNLSGDQPLITMRGSLASNPTNPTADASVSFYMDGVYLGNLTGSAFDISDIERIEVIRGPAGTLFGTNSTAGAINYITAGPKGRLYGRQELSYGRFNSFRSKTRLDLPEWHGLSASATYLHNYRGSNVRNINSRTWDVRDASLNKVDTVTTARKLGWMKTDAFHGAIQYRPFDGLDLDYRFDYSKGRDPGPASQIIGFSTGPGGVPSRNILASQIFFGGPSLDEYVQQERSRSVYNDMTSVATTKITSHYLAAEYQANDNLTIKNIASWRNVDRGYRLNQLDGAGGVVLPDATGALQPFSLVAFNAAEKRNQFSNETQFIVDTDPLSVTAGLFYYNRYTIPGTYISQVFPFTSFSNYVVPGTYVGSQRETFYRSRQIAGYGQATYHLTPKFDVTGGIRYTQDAKTIFDGTLQPGKTFEYNKGKFTWLANVSYRPTDDMMVYAKYTTGYVAGGLAALQATVTDPGGPGVGDDKPVVVSVSSTYKEETARSIEAGLKADFLDRRLRTNFALFYVKYGNLQSSAPVQLSAVVPSGQTVNFTTFSISNIGKSRTYGLEYELLAMPIQGLTLSATGAYNNFKYIDAPAGFDIPVYRPKFTANLGAEYAAPVSGDMRFSIRGDAEYKSSLSVLNFRVGTPASLPENVRLNEIGIQKPLWLFHARASLTDVPLGPTKARVSIWGRNLTNKQRLNSSGDLGTVFAGVFDDPTTYGIDLTVEF